ncbi:unnamed protein product [Mytilus edulis]|uniref:Ig-like domain-containing protein n=1 Tax=Mytilus edulis TaxID=6550 RepID=A0A8S3UDX3_MYTED|nr:unnamed protein product [Mytilus edulis]
MTGTTVNLRCSVESNLKISLQFDCLNISIRKTKLSKDIIMQVSIPLKANINLDMEICTCVVQYKKYKATTSIRLNISSESNGNLSILAIRQSSYSDSGCYSCNAWNTKGETQYWSNKTTSVVVNAAPVIIRTYTYYDTLPTFSVIYFANPVANIPQWFKYKSLLIDSSGFSIHNIRRNISFEIYGKLTQQTIYSSNLSMEEQRPGKFTVILSNDYGKVRTTFNWKPDKPGQLFLFGLLVLTGMLVFILTAGVIAVVTKIKSTIGDSNFKQYQPNNRRAIYYAAPEEENTPQVYHRTDPEYDEPSPGHYMEISDINVDRNSSTTDYNQYEIAHDYIELE